MNNLLLSSAVIYIGSNVVNQALPFFLLPLLTRYLTPLEYGILATMQAILAFIAPLVILGTTGALGRLYWDLSKSDLSVYVGGILKIVTLISLLMLMLMFLIKSYIGALFNVPGNWIVPLVSIGWASTVTSLHLTVWQMEKKALQFGVYRVTQTSATLSLSILFVVIFLWNWRGQLVAMVLGATTFSVISLYIMFKQGTLSFSSKKEYIYDALNFGFPLMLHEVASVVIGMSGILFVNAMVGVSSSGPFMVALTIGQVISLFNSSFGQAWVPYVFERLKTEDQQKKIELVKISYLFLSFIVLFALLVGYGAPFIFKIFVGKDFQDASIYVLWIAFAFAANGMYRMMAIYIYYVKKTYLLAEATFFTAIVHVLGNLLLIKINGALGAAQALFISQTFGFVVTLLFSNQAYKMPWFLVFLIGARKIKRYRHV